MNDMKEAIQSSFNQTSIFLVNFERRLSPSYLSQFEDVFFPVDDLEAAVGAPNAYVARVEPTIGVQSLRRLHGIF